jgi:formamidopyrimidine-DNA glycosylase
MPELPDIELYLDALHRRTVGHILERVVLRNPFVLRSVEPKLDVVFGRPVVGLRRLGKRIVFEVEDELYLVLHLMIAGRLRWKDAGAKVPPKAGLALFEFTSGAMLLTEAGKKRRASLHVVRGEDALSEHDRGGLEVLQISIEEFATRLGAGNHSVKRALCDPRLFSGIGNAYSDEILHAARLSPFKRTQSLNDGEVARLFDASRATLGTWVERLKQDTGTRFPDKITVFRPEMAVHGKFGEPCPECGATVQRIVYASNETNYCPVCQTEGRLLRDRALSRLLRDDWPQSIEELEETDRQPR